MKQKTTISFLYIHDDLLHDNMEKIYEYLRRNEFVEDMDYGFRETLLQKTKIYSTVIRKTRTYISTFDFASSSFVREELLQFNHDDFVLDFENQVLELYGSSRSFPKIRSMLNIALGTRLHIESVDTSAAKVVNKFIETLGSPLDITKLTINNFRLEEGVIGKYEPNISNLQIGLQLISKYDLEIIKYSISFELSSQVKLIFTKHGKIGIECDENDFGKILDIVKGVILKR